MRGTPSSKETSGRSAQLNIPRLDRSSSLRNPPILKGAGHTIIFDSFTTPLSPISTFMLISCIQKTLLRHEAAMTLEQNGAVRAAIFVYPNHRCVQKGMMGIRWGCLPRFQRARCSSGQLKPLTSYYQRDYRKKSTVFCFLCCCVG